MSNLVAGGLSSEQKERQLDELAALYAEETDVRHPLDSREDPVPLRSRAEVRAHFANSGGNLGDVGEFAPTDAVVYRTDDPELVIFEFRYSGVVGGQSFSIPNIYVVRVRNGEIVESRDYADHVGFARVFTRPGPTR
ncbi:MAG: nuclear transport factor 2 family protein [Nocardia sp.]|nr:nuclear transport factor 2 family protein [Nocardia sp.]